MEEGTEKREISYPEKLENKGDLAMKFVKQFMLSFLFIFPITILVFIQHLFLQSSQGKLVWSISIFILFIILIYGIYHIFRGKLKLGFLQGRIGAMTIILMSIILAINITVISISNIVLSEIYSESATTFQKLGGYKRLVNTLVSKKSYIKSVKDNIETMNQEKLGYLNLYYDGEIDKYHVDLIKEFVPQAEEATSLLFGKVNKENVNVIFYSREKDFEKYTKDFRENTRGLNYLSGMYNVDMNSIHLNRFSKEQADWEIGEIFMHEYAHYIYELYLSQNNIGNNIPLWFNEGIAEYIGYNGSVVEYSPSWMQKTEKFTNMNADEDFQRLLRNEKYNPYLQSYYAVNTLIKDKGPSIITDILQKSKEKEFYEAFSEAVGMNIEKFQDVYLQEYIDEYNERI